MPTADQKVVAAALQLHRAGDWVAAERAYRQVLAADPRSAEALHLLGVLRHQQGHPHDAAELIRRAVELDPDNAHARRNLGGVLVEIGKPLEAVEILRPALFHHADCAEAYNSLGCALQQTGSPSEAVEAFRTAIALRPEYGQALHHLGRLLGKGGRPGEAVDVLRRAAAHLPGSAAVCQDLAGVLSDLGSLDAALATYRRGLALPSATASLHSGYLFTLHYDPGSTPDLLFAEHVMWATRYAPPAPTRPHDNDRSPGRRLRVGYASADFREHPVAHFLLPILTSYDRDQLEVYCYSGITQPDPVTQRLQPLPDHWRDTTGLSDAALAELVRSDRIDILVDLAGHAAGNRLLAFARRPAPVQVTHFNYPDTTGMAAMDYRITDALAEPTGASEAYSTERLVRLPHCGWCFDPVTDVPEVNPPPHSANGYVTFASLNKPIKHSEPTVALWAKILHAVPNSRLLLLGVDADPANPTLAAWFAPHGIGRERLRFAPQCPRRHYLALYHDADIALDPFPYNGGVTSCDALWMGVPLVTLEGNTYHSRQGVMLLSNLGLKDLIARTPEAYVDVAVALATDPARLAHLRSQLRSRMAASPIGDGATFTRALQAAYRAMWTRWCEVVTGRACHHDERRSRLP